MLLIPCPYCGPRPELEFRYAGQAHIVRNTQADDAAWGDILYTRHNTRGVLAERWRHVSGCGRFFNCLRDTVSDTILQTYRIGEPQPDLGGKVQGAELGDVASDPSVAATEATR